MRRFAALLLLCVYVTPAHAAQDRSAVTVLADQALSIPMTEISRKFAAESHISVACIFSPPLRNLQRVDDGDAADVLITAYDYVIEKMKRKGLIDVYSQKKVAAAPLAFLTSDALAEKGEVSLESGGDVLIASPTLNPSGQLAEAFLEKLNKVNKLYFINPDVLKEQTEKNNAPALTYAAEAMRLNGIVKRSSSYAFPVATFSGVVVAGENMDKSRKLMEFLASEQARKIFEKYGFSSSF